MNKARRKWLGEIIDKLEEQKMELDSLIEEEQEAYDNMPESLQDGERGQAMSDIISDLETERDSIEDVMQNLLEISER